MSRRTVLVAYGTRPEAIKLAPVVLALTADDRFTSYVVSSGQHREMLDQVSALFGIEPDVDLALMRPDQPLPVLTARAVAGFGARMAAVRPEAVVVQGDTTTAFAAALAAFYARVPVVHVEAGLRTGERYSPFPEEVNRRLIAQLASVHCAPTPGAAANLLVGGEDPLAVQVTGNTVVDALLHVAAGRPEVGDPVVDAAIVEGRRLVTVTAHRRESWGEGLRSIGRAVGATARAHPELLVVVPVHRNPVVRDDLLPGLRDVANVRVVEPLGYAAFTALMAASHVVVSDSGGVQEEAPSLGVPVLVTRDVTERPEVVVCGAAELVGRDERLIEARLTALLDDPVLHRRMSRARNPFGDGHAAERVVACVAELLGAGARLPAFVPTAAAHSDRPARPQDVRR